jgi:hypothetical protein
VGLTCARASTGTRSRNALAAARRASTSLSCLYLPVSGSTSSGSLVGSVMSCVSTPFCSFLSVPYTASYVLNALPGSMGSSLVRGRPCVSTPKCTRRDKGSESELGFGRQ